jgi:hypothetical protein
VQRLQPHIWCRPQAQHVDNRSVLTAPVRRYAVATAHAAVLRKSTAAVGTLVRPACGTGLRGLHSHARVAAARRRLWARRLQ